MNSTNETISKNTYLIIAGTNKAGTTSLYEYLAAHPSVCTAFIKQTFFFLDKEWQQKLDLKSLYDYDNGVDQFGKFFRDPNPLKYKLEASPEYLYSPGCAERLAHFFDANDGKIIFILRNPVSRFISLFKFGKQLALINKDCSFHDFIYLSKNNVALSNTSLMAYETGFYSKYIENYLKLLGTERIKIYFFEDLVVDNRCFMKRVAHDLGLDESFYDDFSFAKYNETVTVRNESFGKLYLKLRGFIIEHTYKSTLGFKIAEILKRTATPLYRKMNMTESENEYIADEDRAYLREVYQQEREKLETLLNVKVPW